MPKRGLDMKLPKIPGGLIPKLPDGLIPKIPDGFVRAAMGPVYMATKGDSENLSDRGSAAPPPKRADQGVDFSSVKIDFDAMVNTLAKSGRLDELQKAIDRHRA
jgi:hypothetical protein